jgi:hypothetical protein
MAETVTPSPVSSASTRATRWPGSADRVAHEMREPSGPVVQPAPSSAVGATTCTSTFSIGTGQPVPTAF